MRNYGLNQGACDLGFAIGYWKTIVDPWLPVLWVHVKERQKFKRLL